MRRRKGYALHYPALRPTWCAFGSLLVGLSQALQMRASQSSGRLGRFPIAIPDLGQQRFPSTLVVAKEAAQVLVPEELPLAMRWRETKGSWWGYSGVTREICEWTAWMTSSEQVVLIKEATSNLHSSWSRKSQKPLPVVATHTPSALMCSTLRRMAAGTRERVSLGECLSKSCEQENTPHFF